jgi:hypothetical protein
MPFHRVESCYFILVGEAGFLFVTLANWIFQVLTPAAHSLYSFSLIVFKYSQE